MRCLNRWILVFAAAVVAFPAAPARALDWVEVATLSHAGGSAGDIFGISVAVDGDVAVVGADPATVTQRLGMASVFVRLAGVWTEVATLMPSDGNLFESFGYSVAIRGNTIAVGSYTNPDYDAQYDGRVYVFERPATGWSGTLVESARLEASALGERLDIGAYVAFAGDSIVTTSLVTRSVLYLFEKPATGWSGTVYPSAFPYADPGAGPLVNVAASGDVIVAGAAFAYFGALYDAGKAFVWVKPPAGWSGFVSSSAELLASDPIDAGHLGNAVAIDGTTILVAEFYFGTTVVQSGHKKVYVYERPIAGWTGSLTESALLEGSDVVDSDDFGRSVSIAGSRAVVGAPDGAFIDPGPARGALYVFDRPGAAWSGTVSETAEFIGPASIDGMPYEFGWSTAMSGGVIVAGARSENVNGNVRQGAAHVFELTKVYVVRARFLIEGPIRVPPGVPVQFPVRVDARPRVQLHPTGVVVIGDDEGQVCRAELSDAGEASCELTFPVPGVYRVRAHYLGNAQFKEDWSPKLTVRVGGRRG